MEPTDLPNSIYLQKFAAARCKEIQTMRKCLSMSSSTKMAFQKLPKHMRRRAMSHNVKRLPRRLREIHKSQMQKSGLPPKQKRPTRKYRRRPNNLKKDHIRRQVNCRWLDTHIWHAKRFYMIEKWGYKLPNRPCDRSYRACYRATTKHCLLQDISYFNCLEIKGQQDVISEGFRNITNKSCGLSIDARAFIRGNREGKITLFKFGDVKKPIGVVYFNWKVQENTERNLWLWIHAAFYEEALQNIQATFSQTTVKLTELKNELSRFRLTGPLATAILQNCFKPFDTINPLLKFDLTGQNDDYEIFKSIPYSSSLSPHKILSIISIDPRYNFPKKRTKAQLPEITQPIKEEFSLQVAPTCSLLWNESFRLYTKSIKPSNSQICELRQKLLVPGTDLDEKSAPLPIILIQRPGNKNGYSGGWDVVLPSHWTQALWMGLVMWGGRAGGLKESKLINFEAGQLDFLLPDTEAGVIEDGEVQKNAVEEYFRKPPNKRVNYTKFGIASPFVWNWKLLMEEWDGDGEYFVVRDGAVLKAMQDWVSTRKELKQREDFNRSLVGVRLNFLERGLCKEFAIICIPIANDFKKLPIEDKRIDSNQKLRSQLRSEHKELLKRLRQRRKRAKKLGKSVQIDEEMLRKYRDRMRELWLPSIKTIKDSCSRKVMGFVTQGDFQLMQGHSNATGFVSFNALKSLIESTKSNRVLVRNTNTRQYRLATLEIIYN